MCLISKAEIFFALDKINQAKDLLRKAMHNAETGSQRMQMVNSYIGLAKIYIYEEKWPNAIEYLEKAEEVEIDLGSANEISEIDNLWSKIPRKVLKKNEKAR